ncbi:adenosine kinase [Trichosporon asahii var. asahii CBS 2479]|uniref:adenosine kinase n=1 Tax=Trichosporon asahii var. asahii (strain ATCC 90039 / CBS 2479 / JCM 2466 / KCTC 7840 / NBRC 103889/ NCYC 2677 / UAMH 7654) TaxID=1186058 RepID=J5RCM3_TRIAS|nr:adenosine kinase [Trichosporon asahii var. asahii CBS 2479]EJT51918.1 adenosine kinase [Trichosporon asahii var. asahii CBS 2479]
MEDQHHGRPISDEIAVYPNVDEKEWTLDNFYYNRERRTWIRRPKRDPHIVFFGLPLYSRMYEARYNLRGNTNKVATKEYNEIKFTHCDFNTFMDDVLKDRERKCKLGGEIQFAAIAAQPDSTVVIGSIGDDYAGTVCLDGMKKNNVKTIYKTIKKEQTGFRVLWNDFNFNTGEPESCRWTVPLAGAKWNYEWLKEPEVEAEAAKMSWLYIDAGSIYAHLGVARTLAERADNEGQGVVFNFCMTDLARIREYYAFQPLCKAAHVVIMNKDQAECIEREWGSGKADWEKGIRHIGRLYPKRVEHMMLPLPNGDSLVKYVIVTRGSEDIAICKFSPLLEDCQAKITYVKTPPAEKPEYWEHMPRDRRGVGELFAGGLVAGLAKGQSIEEAVATGHKLAAYSLNYMGPVLPGQEEEYEDDEF